MSDEKSGRLFLFILFLIIVLHFLWRELLLRTVTFARVYPLSFVHLFSTPLQAPRGNNISTKLSYKCTCLFGLFGRRGGVEGHVASTFVSPQCTSLNSLIRKALPLRQPRLCSRQQFQTIEGPHAPAQNPHLLSRPGPFVNVQSTRTVKERSHNRPINRQHNVSVTVQDTLTA